MTAGPAAGVAVIGMAGVFPGASSVNALWDALKAGRELLTWFTPEQLAAAGVPPEEAGDPAYVPVNGVIEDIDRFDATLFGYSPTEASVIDPQHRIMLQVAWTALEDAGRLRRGERVGVFAGASMNSYLLNHVLTQSGLRDNLGLLQIALGNEKDHLATRIAYKLDLRGPALTVQTACSTSLVAVHLAVQSLLRGECDAALAGAASVVLPQESGYLHSPHDIASPDGHCRAFDKDAHGTVPGNGAAMVVLKRLEDALADGDRIRAVIRGTAINNDGSGKAGYTAPSVAGQTEVIRAALRSAGLRPESIGYVETHGTGTEIGDAVEVAALAAAYKAEGGHPGVCAIGSVKPNIGHLDAAAGVTSLIKAVLAIEEGLIPPSINFSEPNPEIPFEGSPFRVNTQLSAFPGPGIRRCGVSSFGMGGTNAHVIVEEAPSVATAFPEPLEPELVVLSAATEESLRQSIRRLSVHLRDGAPALADTAGTLRSGRAVLPHRTATVASDHADLADQLTRVRISVARRSTSVVMLFPGQGAQRAGMAKGLYDRFSAFRGAVDECTELFYEPLSLDVRELLCQESLTHDIGQTRLTQPCLFTFEYALAKLFLAWGVRPALMLGHSIGEFTAAALAEAVDLRDAVQLVAERGRIMQASPPGRMVAIRATESEVRGMLLPGLSVAAVNGPQAVVVSGPSNPIAQLTTALTYNGVGYTDLAVSHAFHSSLMTSAAEEFRKVAERVVFYPLRTPIISNVTAEILPRGFRYTADYWVGHMLSPVLFGAGATRAAKTHDALFLETGPGTTLTTMVHQQQFSPAPVTVAAIGSTPRSPAERVTGVLRAAGDLWTAGVPVDLDLIDAGRSFRRVSLPTYAFERQRHWLDGRTPTPQADVSPQSAPPAPSRDAEVRRTMAVIWIELLGVPDVAPDANFFTLGGHSLLMVRLIARIQRAFGVRVEIRDILATPTLDVITDHVLSRMASR